jgi:hypothetical protein
MTTMRRLIALAAVAAMLFSPSARAFERLAKPEIGSLLTRVNGHYAWRGCRGRGCGHHHGYANGFALMYYVHNYPRGISPTFGAPRVCFCDHHW